MNKYRKPFYKYCIVPMCKNTIRNAPNKVFFHIPRDVNVRKLWCKAMSRVDLISPMSCLYCCEDHFTIEEDTENYMQYKIMTIEQGKKVTLRLKKGIIPHIFQCQKNIKPLPKRKRALKRKRLVTVEESLPEPALKEYGTAHKIEPDKEEKSNQHTEICNNCQNVIVGFRYKCVTCVDYNLCKKCEMMEIHSEHYVLRIPKPLKREDATEMEQKLQRIFKPDEDIPQIKQEELIIEYSDDERLQGGNVDENINLFDESKNIIHSEVSCVIEEYKDRKEPPLIIRRKRKKLQNNETCDTAVKVNAAPEIAFADANSDFDIQNTSIEIKQEVSEESEVISKLDVCDTVNSYPVQCYLVSLK